MSNRLYNMLAYVPLASGCFYWFIILLATIKLGHLPVYGADPDPTAMGFEWLEFISLLFFLTGFLLAFVWPLLTLIFFVLNDRDYQVGYPGIIAYLAGIALFFCLKYIFPTQFAWVVD